MYLSNNIWTEGFQKLYMTISPDAVHFNLPGHYMSAIKLTDIPHHPDWNGTARKQKIISLDDAASHQTPGGSQFR